MNGLERSGYRDGVNVVIDYALADGQADALPGLACGLADRGPRVIVGLLGVLAASRSTRDITVVGASARGDLVALGLVRNLEHPAPT